MLTAEMCSHIDRAVAMRPDRIALFGFAHVPWMRRTCG
jgi:coproporphyrinogen III oxidase-like Fe-S oxidoreductase